MNPKTLPPSAPEPAAAPVQPWAAADVRRLYLKDSINLLKYYDYVPIQKKDSLRYEHLA